MTTKHILLGFGIDCKTGLRKPVDILAKLGHSCSYGKVRKIETAQANLAQYFPKMIFFFLMFQKKVNAASLKYTSGGKIMIRERKPQKI